MTNRLENPPSRQLACSRCGTAFTCSLSGPCWCADESFRLPMPVDGEDCLCPACLRKMARQADGGTSAWNIAAVLLDMDGTLLDTEKVYFDSLAAALQSCGFSDDITALCHAMIGLPGPECERLLIDRYGVDFPLHQVNAAFRAHSEAIFQAGLPLKPGTVELLDALQAAACPMAIVTSSSRRSAESHLTRAGIRARFDTILTRDDVVHCKPSPDLYFLAARQLGVRPEACVAIEDSNHGVAAAHAAGILTIMVPDMVPPSEAARAKCAAVLPDLHMALELLQARCGFARGQ